MIIIVERNFIYLIFQHRPISLRLKGSSRCSKTFHCVPRLILKFFSQSLELDTTTKTQFHTHLITAGVLVDAKRGGCQNNQGYRWRWLPGWQQEIWCLCHMFGSLCHLSNCHTARCLCHKNVVLVTQLCLHLRRSTASHNWHSPRSKSWSMWQEPLLTTLIPHRLSEHNI